MLRHGTRWGARAGQNNASASGYRRKAGISTTASSLLEFTRRVVAARGASCSREGSSRERTGTWLRPMARDDERDWQDRAVEEIGAADGRRDRMLVLRKRAGADAVQLRFWTQEWTWSSIRPTGREERRGRRRDPTFSWRSCMRTGGNQADLAPTSAMSISTSAEASTCCRDRQGAQVAKLTASRGRSRRGAARAGSSPSGLLRLGSGAPTTRARGSGIWERSSQACGTAISTSSPHPARGRQDARGSLGSRGRERAGTASRVNVARMRNDEMDGPASDARLDARALHLTITGLVGAAADVARV